MHPVTRSHRAALVAFVLACACGGLNDPWSTTGPGGDPRTRGGGREDAWSDPDTREAFCESGGPPVEVGDSEGTVVVETCAGAIAERVFTYALCTCQDTNVAGYLTTRSFDSEEDPEVIASGGPVGVNGQYFTTGYADVGGSFTIAGNRALTFAGYVYAGGDLSISGNVTAAGYLEVSRDAWMAGDVTIPGYSSIGRDLHQPLGRQFLSILSVGGETFEDSFVVDPPCACGTSDLVDIGAIVDHARTHNDNADIGLSPSALNDVVGIGVELDLPCGRFYLERISGLGGITLRAASHTALFVEGDVDAVGALWVELGPEGELDLFIKGNLVSIGAGSFGSEARPSATRIYVGGDGDVLLIGASDFVGNVYAPRSRITSVGAAFVYGSLFGRTIDIPGALMVHYDRDILDAGEDCDGGEDGGDPDWCDRCDNSCAGNRACVDGECIDCRSDADCCEPLVCWPDGTCGPMLI